jgi:hypothetical protein
MKNTKCGICEIRLEMINLGESFTWYDKQKIDGQVIDTSHLHNTEGGQCPTCGLVYGYNKNGEVRRLLIAAGKLLPELKPDLTPEAKRQLFPNQDKTILELMTG